MRILAIAAHPDDEALGCGATLAKLAGQGHTIGSLILADTTTARLGQLPVPKSSQVHSAAKVLGATYINTLSLPDNAMDSLPLLQIVQAIEGCLADFRPDVIFTHHPGDLNIDHSTTARAVITATRPFTTTAHSIYLFPIQSATEWAFGRLAPTFQANTFSSITSDHLATKLAAMQVYDSELRELPHPRSLVQIQTAAQYWGGVAGCELAEPFEVLRTFIG